MASSLCHSLQLHININIKAKASIHNKEIDCIGSIEIRWINSSLYYVTWVLMHDNNLIASKSEDYYLKESTDLHKNIKARIENYRIGRTRIFKDIIFDDHC